jgi:putative N6-adenine-specific DNA methylase
MLNFRNDILIAKTQAGLEEVLEDELRAMGAEDVQKIRRGVQYRFGTDILYKSNLALRTALRIIKPYVEFDAKNEDELYHGAMAVRWADLFDADQTFLIDFTVNSPFFRHSQFAALKLKDAICDRFRKDTGKRPSVSKENPHIQFNLRIFNEKVTISVDTSGESLHKRGTRVAQNDAPLNEVLASGLILLSGWDKQSVFADGMCGSGTLLTEAASLAMNKAPNINRKSFIFNNLKDFDETTFNNVTEQLRNAETNLHPDARIFGADISRVALEIARQNIEASGFSDSITIERSSFRKWEPPVGPGTLILNPPYGERMEQENPTAFYKEIGDIFKQKYAGYNCWVISSNLNALKNLGLHPTRKITLMNGALDCRFMKYVIYEGSKKQTKE